MTSLDNLDKLDRPRIAALDVLRGFALCGILLVNIPSIVDVRVDSSLLDSLAVHRFFPIFSLLFGIGFSLLFDAAAGRVARPRVVLLRRLVVLLGFGLVHMFGLWPGDILTTYAVVGLVVLLPSTWLPRWAVAGLSGLLVVAALVTGDGGITLVPGLFLLGSALVQYGVITRLEQSTRVPAVLALVFSAAAVPGMWFEATSGIAGLLLSGTYVCVLLVLLRTPLRAGLRACFAPLGRMALTNYLTATILVLIVDHAFFSDRTLRSSATVFLIAGCVLGVQWLWSTLWLRRYRQGPLEWLWRRLTWGQGQRYA